MTEPPRTKPALINLINERWSVLQDLISRLSNEDFERPLGDGWSAKVHLGHITAWERSALALLRGEHRGDAMGLPRDMWDAHNGGNEETWPASGDAVNAALAESTEAQTLAQVRAESESTHASVIAQLESMTQEELELPYSHFQPDDLPFNANPVAGWVHGNTWEHYNEHIGWLEAGLKS